MKVLLVGGGGREHALAWKFRNDAPDLQLIAAPGNPGIQELGKSIAIPAHDVGRLVDFARTESVDLVVVGPEVPLEAGLVDRLRTHRIPAFGPTAAAARIETSKSWAKDLMVRAGVPTARAVRCSNMLTARKVIGEFGAPVVIKATGLAAGKGVAVCGSIGEALAAAGAMLEGQSVGDAGREILVEEFMEGEELSLFVLTDGTAVLPMLPVQDHKRLGDGDTGPNTGGMGAYAPVSIGTDELIDRSIGEVVLPTLAALREAGHPFTGLLYAGLMITATGPRVVEYNCRFGDPETQALLPLLRSNLLERIVSIANGDGVGAEPLDWHPGAAVTTVVASAGYPGPVRSGVPITRAPEDKAGTFVFHAGTARASDGSLVTAGGRVMAVTGTAPTFEEARAASRAGAQAVQFSGAIARTDIGWREAARVQSHRA